MMNDLNNYRFFLLKVAKANLNPTLHSWAEDIVQDTFIKAERNKDSFDESKGKLVTWLAQITVNLCRDFSKKKVNNEVCYGDFYTLQANEDGNDSTTKPPSLRPYLQLINPRYRKALLLKIYFGMSAKEMAKHLDIPPSSVPVLIQRAKESLGAVLKNDGSDLFKAA